MRHPVYSSSTLVRTNSPAIFFSFLHFFWRVPAAPLAGSYLSRNTFFFLSFDLFLYLFHSLFCGTFDIAFEDLLAISSIDCLSQLASS